MALSDHFGFESPLVLMKLGNDLRERLDKASDATMPEGFDELIERIPDHQRDVLLLSSDEYKVLDDDLAF